MECRGLLVFFWFPIIWQFSWNSLFQQKGAKIVFFFQFLCFKSIFWKLSFLGLPKHYKNRGFSYFWCFLVVEREEKGNKVITEISGFGFFLSKNGRFVTQSHFPKNVLLKPLFLLCFLGCALFWLITEKLILGVFSCFSCVFCLWLLFVFLVRWPEGTSLGPKPSKIVFFLEFFVVFVFGFFCFGGFKGQVRWPEGPPILALNPSYLYFV